MIDAPVNGKYGRSAPYFVHVMLHATVVTDIFFIRADTLFTT
jgi:hypothetical protein